MNELGDNLFVLRLNAAQVKFGGLEGINVFQEENSRIAEAIKSTTGMEQPQGEAAPRVGRFETKGITVNTRTGKVRAYRTEAFTMQVSWGKTLGQLAMTIVTLAALPATFLGFLAFCGWAYSFFKDAGVELTPAEVIVFTAVYDHRDENQRLLEADLLRYCTSIAKTVELESPTPQRMTEALNLLHKLGIVAIEDGWITLADTWKREGKWL